MHRYTLWYPTQSPELLMSDNLKGKDGFARNLVRFRVDYRQLKEDMAIPLLQYREAKGIGQKLHKAMNLVTESFRAQPYLMAHIAVYGVLLYIAIRLIVWAALAWFGG